MIAAFVIGLASGVALASASVVFVASMSFGGRSAARHWEQVQRLIYEGGER
jgi:hypothetical protein